MAWDKVFCTPYKLTLCIIIIINGRENKCTTAIIITCKPILTSRSRFDILVSAGEANVKAHISKAFDTVPHNRLPRKLQKLITMELMAIYIIGFHLS